jgi:hypothetical protein
VFLQFLHAADPSLRRPIEPLPQHRRLPPCQPVAPSRSPQDTKSSSSNDHGGLEGPDGFGRRHAGGEEAAQGWPLASGGWGGRRPACRRRIWGSGKRSTSSWSGQRWFWDSWPSCSDGKTKWPTRSERCAKRRTPSALNAQAHDQAYSLG